MSRMVIAVCEKQVYDSKKCVLYYPGDQDEIDLDDDVALCFKLLPKDRAYARESALKRATERQEEYAEVVKEGFRTVAQLREHKKALQEDSTEDEERSDNETYPCPRCGKECASKLGLGSHMRSHNKTATG